MLSAGSKERQPMWKTVLSLICLSLALLVPGCNQEEAPVKVNLAKKEQVLHKAPANVITYAYLPQYSHTVSYERHRLLVEFLRRETGYNIKQVFPDTFAQHMDMVGQGKIDISFVNPFVYVTLAKRYDSRVFASVMEGPGSSSKFRGQIICRADNPAIATLADCRGKRWIAVDPNSAAGYLYALGLFYSQGLRPEDFAEIAFAPGPGGKQEKVVLAVWAGKYDIGSIREGTLNVVGEKIDLNEIRVIATTPWYPGWVYSARAGLDPEVTARIASALLKLSSADKEQRRILDAAHIMGFVPAQDRDYDPIRNLVTQVGIHLD